MPRSGLPMLALALTAAAGLTLAACGGEDAKLLPGETAREITANLDTVQQLSDEGDCIGAESAAQQVGEQIAALSGVDRKLKGALEDGAGRLEEVIAGCEEASEEAVAPAVVPTEPETEEEGDEAAGGKEKKQRDKEEGKRAKEEKAPAAEGPPSLPPQAEGEAKGHEEGNVPPGQEAPEESPSGGVSPGSPAGGEQG